MGRTSGGAASTSNPVGADLDLAAFLLVGNAGSTGIAIGANGEVTMAAQPAVLATNGADDVDVTGDATEVTVDFDTEIYDQNADFASDTFTAPVTGLYHVDAFVDIAGLTATTSDNAIIRAKPSNRTKSIYLINANLIPTQFTAVASLDVDMDALDTLTVVVSVNGEGSKTADILGDGTEMESSLSVRLVA